MQNLWHILKCWCDGSRLVACQEWNMHQYMLWYERWHVRCAFLHYTTTTSLFKSTHRTHCKHAIQHFSALLSHLDICTVCTVLFPICWSVLSLFCSGGSSRFMVWSLFCFSSYWMLVRPSMSGQGYGSSALARCPIQYLINMFLMDPQIK